MFNTPILLIGFNRPDKIIQVLDSIISINPNKLYVHLDAPRINNESDTEKCDIILKYIESLNVNFKVYIHRSVSNLGCSNACINALDWFFENEEEGIILEDDCLPSNSFFNFCQEMLNKYRYSENIGIISGSNLGLKFEYNEDYFFSRYAQIWGWATWKKSWNKFQVEVKASNLEIMLNDIKNYRERTYWKLHFSGDVIWDVKWAVYSLWFHKMLSILPQKNLVKNIGFDQDATNYFVDKNNTSNQETFELSFPLIHPNEVRENLDFSDKIFQDKYFPLLGYKSYLVIFFPYLITLYIKLKKSIND